MGLKIQFVDGIPPSERIKIQQFIVGMDASSWVHEYAFRGGDISAKYLWIGTRVLVTKGWHQDGDLHHFTAKVQGVHGPPYVSMFW
jgi:hypothetical protein